MQALSHTSWMLISQRDHELLRNISVPMCCLTTFQSSMKFLGLIRVYIMGLYLAFNCKLVYTDIGFILKIRNFQKK